MKKILRTTLAIVMVLTFGVNANAAVPGSDVTAGLSASATVGAVTTLSILPTSITYTTVDANTFPTAGGVTVTYASNYDPWKIAIYTDNTGVPDYGLPNGRYAKGGLAKSDGSSVVPMKWICQDDATAAPAIGTIGGYNYVKDLNDEDDPGTGDLEDWNSAFADGYANIAYGGTGYGWCIDPTAGAPYTGDAADGTIAVYIAALFGDASPTPGSYSATVTFDLYHE